MTKGCNLDVKKAMRDGKVRQWQVAESLEINESVLSRMMRKELSPDIKVKIFEIIEIMKEKSQELQEA